MNLTIVRLLLVVTKKRSLFSMMLLVITASTAMAQTGFEQLIKAGPADAEKLVNAYGTPLLKGFGLGMNSGWTNSAKTLGLFHFDIRVSATAVIVPSSERTFDVTKIGLSSNLRPANPNDIIAQSFSGKDVDGPLMDIYDTNGNKLTSFYMPQGLIESFVPTPQVQVTLGLFQNTDVSVRAIPKVKLNNDIGKVSLFGFGIKHNFIQDFAGADDPMPFDFALAFSYSRLNYSKSINLQPEGIAVAADASQVKDFNTQELYGNFDNYLFQAVLSKQLSIFTPYISVGYNISKTDLGLKGNYPIINGITDNQLSYTTYTDPVSINTTHVKGIRADMGFQVKFPVLTLYGSYGLAERYSMVNVGIGIGF